MKVLYVFLKSLMHVDFLLRFATINAVHLDMHHESSMFIHDLVDLLKY